MSNYDAAFVTAMRGVIASAWSLSDASIFRVSQMNRINLQERIASGDIPVPCATFDIRQRVPEDHAADAAAYRCPVDVYYFFSSTAAAAQIDSGDATKGYDTAAHAEKQGAALRDAFFAYTGTDFQLVEEQPRVDASDSNPANQIFYQEGNRPFYAVQVSVNLLIGEFG